MAEIFNLRRARKEKARVEKAEKAKEARLAHGQTKAERALAKAHRDLAERQIQGHRLDKEGE